MKGFIYCATSPNGKKYYGQTVQIFEKRKQRHKRDYLKGNCVFHQALIKHSWDNFKWNIIEVHYFEDKKQLINKLNERELYWIKTNKTYFREFGYNMTPGGDNYVHSHEPLSEITKDKIKNALLGKTFTEERRKNISNSLLGKSILGKNFGDTSGNKNGMFKTISSDDLQQIIKLHQQGLSAKKIAPVLNNKYCWAKILKALRDNNVYIKSKYANVK